MRGAVHLTALVVEDEHITTTRISNKFLVEFKHRDRLSIEADNGLVRVEGSNGTRVVQSEGLHSLVYATLALREVTTLMF